MGIESPVHLLFIAIVALIVLGPKRLPALARALGQGIREFRDSLEAGAEPPEAPSERAPQALQPASQPVQPAPQALQPAPPQGPSAQVGERASAESSWPEQPRDSAA